MACRTINTKGIKLLHISWLGDALRIQFGVTKTNQKGERLEDRLIFANPLMPHICPVLALGAYLLTISTPLQEGSALFFGGKREKTFLTSLHAAFKTPELFEFIRSFGLKLQNLTIWGPILEKGQGPTFRMVRHLLPAMPLFVFECLGLWEVLKRDTSITTMQWMPSVGEFSVGCLKTLSSFLLSLPILLLLSLVS